MEVLKVVVVAAMVMMRAAEAIRLELPNSETKCVYEDIGNNVVVIGDYVVIHDDDEHAQPNFIPTIFIQISSGKNYFYYYTTSIIRTSFSGYITNSPYGKNLHKEENATYGRFAFTTTEPGYYVACFRINSQVPGNKSAAISLQWKIGIDAKDWDSIARKENIEGVELKLMKLQGLVQAIHKNLLYLKKRDDEMRVVSKRTNGAVAWFGMMSLSICILAAAVQIWYLKRYFRKNRLI